MADIGQRAQLPVLTKSPHGLFLDAGDPLGEVLLPRKEVTEEMKVGDLLDVFIHCDSEDRPVATLKHPKAMPGEFACLECVDIKQDRMVLFTRITCIETDTSIHHRTLEKVTVLKATTTV